MKQQSTSNEQGQPECNPTPMDPPEHNPAEIKVNSENCTKALFLDAMDQNSLMGQESL